MIPLIRGWTDVKRTTRANVGLGASLSFVAGATNAGGFLGVGQYTSHMTGVVSAIVDNLKLGQLAPVLAGLGGVIFGLDEQVSWNMGTMILLLMFASITLGGLGRPFGALVGSLAVGMFVQLWAWAFSDYTDLKTMGALLAMILVLLFRPQGILGKKERVG